MPALCSALVLFSNNDKGGVLVHFWMIFVVPRLKTPAVCEECVSAILRDSVLTSLKNRSSVGFLLGLPVDIDSIFINSKVSAVDILLSGLKTQVTLDVLVFVSKPFRRLKSLNYPVNCEKMYDFFSKTAKHTENDEYIYNIKINIYKSK